MEFLKKNIFNIITVIPIILLAVGSLVLSKYLSQFGVIDFPVFNGRTILVGFVAFLQLILFIIIWYTFLNIRGNNKKELYFLIFNAIWKPLVFGNTVFLLSAYVNELDDFEFLGWIWYSKILLVLTLFSFMGFMILLSGKEYIDNGIKKDKLGRITLCLGGGLTLVSFFPMLILLINNDIYRNIISTYGYVSFILFFQSFLAWAIKNDKTRGIPVEESSLFSKEKKFTLMDYVFYLFWVMLILIINLFNYSSKVFPYIDTNLGGGKYKFSELILDDASVIKGRVVHTNSDYVYIYEESTLKQIPIIKISEYK